MQPDSTAMAADGEEDEAPVEQVPDMVVAQQAFQATVETDPSRKTALVKQVMATIEQKNMLPWYAKLCSRHPELFKSDAKLEERLGSANDKRVAEIDEALAHAEKDGGDMEILDAMFDKAVHYSRIGDREAAYSACDAILERGKISSGKRIDATLIRLRVGLFFHMDLDAVKEGLEKARKLVNLGGDWDRRNRLKVYEAFYLIKTRDIKGAAALLLECVATFTCTELCSYKDFIFYVVITNILSLPRTSLKKKVIDGPEILTVMPELPNARKLVESLYACEYRSFMEAMVEVNEELIRDRYFSQHTSFLIRELRILAYTQFLNAYQSIILSSMARAFGVSEPFLDKELGRFISAGRLNAKVDKVEGIVFTNRPDEKNAQYQATIKSGDQLLNRVQKLTRIIDV